MLNGNKTYAGIIVALLGALIAHFLPEQAALGELATTLGLGLAGIGAAHKYAKANAPAVVETAEPPPVEATVVPLLLGCVMLAGCTTTNYNIDFHTGAFRVAETMKLDPGQGGDDGSSTAGAPTTGGEDGSPGGSNVLDGFAQQGNIFQIGTAAKSDGEVRTAVTAQSPNSTSGTGEDVVVNGDEPEPEPEPDAE